MEASTADKVLQQRVKVEIQEETISRFLACFPENSRSLFSNLLELLKEKGRGGGKKVEFIGSIIVVNDLRDQFKFFKFKSPPKGCPLQVPIFFIKKTTELS